MRLERPLRPLRAVTLALRRINYHSPGLPYFFWRAGGNSSHSACNSRPQWGQTWSSSLSTSAPALPLLRFPEEPLIALPASGSRLSIRSTTHPLSGFTYPQGTTLHGPALLDEPEPAILLETLHVLGRLHAPFDPPLKDAAHVADPARVALTGYFESLPHRIRREPVALAVAVQELEDVRRRQRPHETEVVVGRNTLGLGPYHLDVTLGKLVLAQSLLRRRRVLGDFEPTIPTGEESGFDQGLKRILDAFRRGAQELGQLFYLGRFVPEVGEDADVETGAASPRPLLPRRCEPNSLHPGASIAAKGQALYV